MTKTMLPSITTIKILHKDYDLLERTEHTEILDTGSYGNHMPNLNKIEWVRHKHDSDNVDTIIHETFHALFLLFGITAKDTEEQIVTKLATGLTTVMKDNKPLFKILLDIL